MFLVKRIPFDECKKFWENNKHFPEDKIIVEDVVKLGPYVSSYGLMHRKQAYGLYSGDEMVSATQLHEWDTKSVRARVWHVKQPYRGRNLYFNFLARILYEDWRNKDYVIGWTRSSLEPWLNKNNFKPFDWRTFEHDGDRYRMMQAAISDVIASGLTDEVIF